MSETWCVWNSIWILLRLSVQDANNLVIQAKVQQLAAIKLFGPLNLGFFTPATTLIEISEV